MAELHEGVLPTQGKKMQDRAVGRITRRQALAGAGAAAAAAAGAVALWAVGSSDSEKQEPGQAAIVGPAVPKELLKSPQWSFVISPEAYSALENNPRPLQQDVDFLDKAYRNLPRFGKLKVVLIGADRSSFNQNREDPTVFIGRNVPDQAKMARDLSFEYAQWADPDANYSALPGMMSAADLQELRNLKAEALADPVFKPNVPRMEDIFSKTKAGLTWRDAFSYPPEKLAALVNLYPDAYWLVQGGWANDPNKRNIFTPYMQQGLELIKRFASTAGKATWNDYEGFLALNRNKRDEIAAFDPVAGLAMDIISEKKHLFTPDRLDWVANTGFDINFSGPFASNYWEGVPYLMNGVLAQGVLEGDSRVLAVLPQEKVATIKANLQSHKMLTDVKTHAGMVDVSLRLGRETPASKYIAKLRELETRSKTV